MTNSFYTEPFCYENYKKTVMQLKKNYPFLKVFSLGKSLFGRELYAFSIGSPYNASLFIGGVHGMEWLTSMLLLRFVEDLCEQYKSIALENRPITIVPCLNPDGIEIAVAGSHWQANARGVDLNHNFDAGFEILRHMEDEAGFNRPGPTRYGGPYAFSEPESAAIAEFCKKYSPRQAYAFHSQGEEIYYEYGAQTPKQSKLIAQTLAFASGYNLVQAYGLASHGGFKDWFIEYFRKPAFTIEIGRGENPLPIAELDPIYFRLIEMLLLSILL